jgi:predicted nucleotidyltransferase
MSISLPYPGTPQHQKFLQAIVSHYANDPRILAIILFGSLSRGNWDPYSDIDLDIIIGDDVQIAILKELERLIYSFPDTLETDALIIPHDTASADIVFVSLMELSVRYHTFMSTSPNIVEGMRILWGDIDEAAIKAATLANQEIKESSAGFLLDRCIRYVLETDIALQRQQLWVAVELLHRIRGLLMELFAQTHHNPRPLYAFQKEADPALQKILGATLPQYSPQAIQSTLVKLLDILEHDLEQLTGGHTVLATTHRKILRQVRKRQQNLSNEQ